MANLSYLYVIIIILVIILIFLIRSYANLKKDHSELLSTKRSIEVKHGLSYENLFPYFKNYPYDSRNFRFIGDPIDGISFEEDKVIFMEFKTGNSKLSSKQKNIKDQIQNKKVEWKEITEN